MTTDRPQVSDNSLYTQAQTARILGIERHTVKSYEDRGLLKFKLRKSDNRKVTTGKQILAVWQGCY